MRAIVYRETGASDVLELIDREPGEPGEGQVRVRLVRAGVNPTDWKFRAGMMTEHDEVTPGQDGAGVVEEVGDGVTDLEIGDRVWLYLAQHGRPYGTAAEQIVLPAANAVPLPDDASFDLGASLGVPAVTAHRALTAGSEVTHLGPGLLEGRTVLVAGGAGAVGNAAIQLAAWSGATVITTVSSEEKAALARAAGADHVVNYREEDVVERVRSIVPQGVDVVVEVAPAQNLATDVEVVRNGGTIAFYANNGGDEVTVPVRATFGKNVRLQGLILYTLAEDLMSAAVAEVSHAVAAGALQVGADAGLPLHHYPLEDTAAAHEAVEAGAVGKVLLDTGEA